jgi:hypothetical protein
VDPRSPSLNPAPANAVGFGISIWANGVGGPVGNPLYAVGYSIGSQVTQTFAGFALFNYGAGPVTVPVYNYAVALNPQFQAQAGVIYWLGIQEISPINTLYPGWGWMSSAGTNVTVYDQFFPPAPRINLPNERTFTLYANTDLGLGGSAPEPSTLTLLGVGGLGLLAVAWRRRWAATSR